MTNDERPLIIVVRTGGQEFREYLLSSMAERFRVHMFLGVPPSWELPYITGSTFFKDTLDTAAMIGAARDLNTFTRISGVMTWDESRTPQTAAIAAALGLPGGDVDAVMCCRDKHLTRLALEAAHVPQPRSVPAATVEEAVEIATEIGFPVIIKPTDLAVSMGVVRVENAADLADRWAVTSAIKVAEIPDYRVKILVEEFVDGPEISIDSAVSRGQVYPLYVAHKEIGFEPYCMEVGHYVHGGDPLMADQDLLRLLSDVHKAVGFTDGVTHTELKVTSHGPKVIEVNGRLGGDLIPYLGMRATGIDTGIVAASIAIGQTPSVMPDRRQVAGIRFFHVEQDDSLISSIRFDTSVIAPEVDRMVLLAQAGERRSTPRLRPLMGRIAFATAVAETFEQCRNALDSAEAALKVEIGD